MVVGWLVVRPHLNAWWLTIMPKRQLPGVNAVVVAVVGCWWLTAPRPEARKAGGRQAGNRCGLMPVDATWERCRWRWSGWSRCRGRNVRSAIASCGRVRLLQARPRCKALRPGFRVSQCSVPRATCPTPPPDARNRCTAGRQQTAETPPTPPWAGRRRGRRRRRGLRRGLSCRRWMARLSLPRRRARRPPTCSCASARCCW